MGEAKLRVDIYGDKPPKIDNIHDFLVRLSWLYGEDRVLGLTVHVAVRNPSLPMPGGVHIEQGTFFLSPQVEVELLARRIKAINEAMTALEDDANG